jgi:hypothetical protein
VRRWRGGCSRELGEWCEWDTGRQPRRGACAP